MAQTTCLAQTRHLGLFLSPPPTSILFIPLIHRYNLNITQIVSFYYKIMKGCGTYCYCGGTITASGRRHTVSRL